MKVKKLNNILNEIRKSYKPSNTKEQVIMEAIKIASDLSYLVAYTNANTMQVLEYNAGVKHLSEILDEVG